MVRDSNWDRKIRKMNRTPLRPPAPPRPPAGARREDDTPLVFEVHRAGIAGASKA